MYFDRFMTLTWQQEHSQSVFIAALEWTSAPTHGGYK